MASQGQADVLHDMAFASTARRRACTISSDPGPSGRLAPASAGGIDGDQAPCAPACLNRGHTVFACWDYVRIYPAHPHIPSLGTVLSVRLQRTHRPALALPTYLRTGSRCLTAAEMSGVGTERALCGCRPVISSCCHIDICAHMAINGRPGKCLTGGPCKTAQ